METRPDIVPCKTYKIKVGCGNCYITTGSWGGSIKEVFITMGQAGSCGTCQGEALGRTISAGLRNGVPVEEFISQLKGIQCPNPIITNEMNILSCADGLAQILEIEQKSQREEE